MSEYHGEEISDTEWLEGAWRFHLTRELLRVAKDMTSKAADVIAPQPGCKEHRRALLNARDRIEAMRSQLGHTLALTMREGRHPVTRSESDAR